jgi:hypothetical protein
MVEARAVADESSPLLVHPVTTSGARPPAPSDTVRRPAILPEVKRICANDFINIDVNSPEQLEHSGDAERVAFELLVLSHLYILLVRQTHVQERDIWDRWAVQQHKEGTCTSIEERIQSVWDAFIRTVRTTAELDTFLWSPFPLEQSGRNSLRGV